MNSFAGALLGGLIAAASFATSAEIGNATECVEPVEIDNHPPVLEGVVFNVVMKNRAWLIDGWCPEQVVLLDMEPVLGLAAADFRKIKAALEADGCTVIEETDESFRGYVNPTEDEWRKDKLKGAISGAVSTCFTVAGDLAIRIGWYKGTLHARSTTVLFRWSGKEWVERTDLKIVTVSRAYDAAEQSNTDLHLTIWSVTVRACARSAAGRLAGYAQRWN